MNKNPIKVGLAALLALMISFSANAAIPELSENMTQGQFAIWLVHAVGASSKLPATPTEDDAIDFLMKLNVQPKEGWQKNSVITKQFLASLLGDDSASSLDFAELINRIRAHVRGLFTNIDQGIFRPFAASGSGSVTI